jgi:plastocyanin
MTRIGWVVAVCLAMGACGKKAGESAAAGGGGGGATTLQVQADPAQFKFQETSLQAGAGGPVTVEFSNPSSAVQPHTFVLVKPGDEEKVDQAAQAKGGDARGVDGVIKATGVVSAGGKESLDLGSLQLGTYSYICTYPGHLAAGMKGTLTVQ